MKKLMILGGSRYAIPLINVAHELGIYTITADYLPENDAHKYSDEYVNVSIIDKEKVLAAAQEREIDGIISFACDPGVVSAAFVAEKMKLPFQCSHETACILQDKGRFRNFLMENGFNCPRAKRYENSNDALCDIDFFTWPVIVKPTDSAGSKGVTRVDRPDELQKAIDIAVSASHNGAYIIEEYLIFDGYHSSTDPFVVDGQLKFITYSDQLFDSEADNPYTPAFIIWPSTMKKSFQDELTQEIQRLMQLLDIETGIFNIETCVANGKAYIMEVSPRGGGCKIAEIQNMAYDVNLIEAEIKKAVGLPFDDIIQKPCVGNWCETVVHARPGQCGVLDSVEVDTAISEKYLMLTDLSVKKGDYIKPFTGANMALGDMFFKFDSRNELERIMKRQKEWLRINLKTN